jgi:chitinase
VLGSGAWARQGQGHRGSGRRRSSAGGSVGRQAQRSLRVMGRWHEWRGRGQEMAHTSEIKREKKNSERKNKRVVTNLFKFMD